MHLLCDHNVAQRYVDSFVAARDLQVVTVGDVLDPRAADPDIADHAAAHGYVVFTGDDDFFDLADRCGCIYYHQESNPPVGAMLAAIRAIEAAYTDPRQITEVVPGGWV